MDIVLRRRSLVVVHERLMTRSHRYFPHLSGSISVLLCQVFAYCINTPLHTSNQYHGSQTQPRSGAPSTSRASTKTPTTRLSPREDGCRLLMPETHFLCGYGKRNGVDTESVLVCKDIAAFNAGDHGTDHFLTNAHSLLLLHLCEQGLL